MFYKDFIVKLFDYFSRTKKKTDGQTLKAQIVELSIRIRMLTKGLNIFR